MRENADYGSLLSTLTVMLRSCALIALLCDPAHLPQLPPPRPPPGMVDAKTISTPVQMFLQVFFFFPSFPDRSKAA